MAEPAQQVQQVQAAEQQGAEPVENGSKWQGVSEGEAQRLVDRSMRRSMFVRFLVDKMGEVRRVGR